MKKCWASSRYEYAYRTSIDMWDIAGYPCPSSYMSKHLNKPFYSEKLPKNSNNPVTYRFELDGIQRISYMSIIWLTCPKEFKIEISEDGENWFKGMEY